MINIFVKNVIKWDFDCLSNKNYSYKKKLTGGAVWTFKWSGRSGQFFSLTLFKYIL